MVEKIFSKSANIENNKWELNNVIILKVNENNSEEIKLEKFNINSIYTHEKINSLFKNFDTLSFIDLIMNYDELSKRGYNKIFSIKVCIQCCRCRFSYL